MRTLPWCLSGSERYTPRAYVAGVHVALSSREAETYSLVHAATSGRLKSAYRPRVP